MDSLLTIGHQGFQARRKSMLSIVLKWRCGRWTPVDTRVDTFRSHTWHMIYWYTFWKNHRWLFFSCSIVAAVIACMRNAGWNWSRKPLQHAAGATSSLKWCTKIGSWERLLIAATVYIPYCSAPLANRSAEYLGMSRPLGSFNPVLNHAHDES